MKLHRADSRPDWESVPLERRSSWQRLAARSKGIVTPGNILSLIGLLVVFVGLVAVHEHHLWRGLVIIGIGRICDILDGIAAEKTSTKSPTGEAVDAGFDKIAALAALIVFALSHITPWAIVLIIGFENLFTGVLSLIAKAAGKPIHPVAPGKLGGAIEWVAFLAFILGAAWHTHRTHFLVILGYLVSIVAIALNALATFRYLQMALQHNERPQRPIHPAPDAHMN